MRQPLLVMRTALNKMIARDADVNHESEHP